MNTIKNDTNTFIDLDFISIIMFLISLFLLTSIALEGSLAPIILYILMIIIGTTLITLFSNKYEVFFKTKLFLFFFSLSLIYTLINHYILVSFFPNTLPFMYVDGPTFYYFSDYGLPYVSGEKNFFDMFSMYKAFKIHELPAHVVFSSLITYFSILIDDSNSIIIQKLLSPFFLGIFSVVLYSTLKYQFKESIFALNATFAYALFSAVFIYSTSLMRDIDVALAYMIFIYIFLQKNSFINFIFLLFVAFITFYLRVESGMVLLALTLLYPYFYVKHLQSKPIKIIFYILVVILASFIIFLMFSKITILIVTMDETNIAQGIAQSSKNSISLMFNKLPFPLSYIAKVFFGQIQPFPFFHAIDRPPEVISGIFWPFIFIMMLYAVIKKDIRILINEKVKYLLMMAIAILFLMSSESMARRMMSVYPIIYITSLYVFFTLPKDKIKKGLFYYLFGIIVLNTIYYLIKL